jgi:hypothetical protein
MALLQTRNLKGWERALGSVGLDPEHYIGALDPEAEVLPWSAVSTGVPDWYLRREFSRARQLVELPVTA